MELNFNIVEAIPYLNASAAFKVDSGKVFKDDVYIVSVIILNAEGTKVVEFSLKMRSGTPDFTGKCGVVLPIFNIKRGAKMCKLLECIPKKCTYFVLVKTIITKRYGEERETGSECGHEGVPHDWSCIGAGSDCLCHLAWRF